MLLLLLTSEYTKVHGLYTFCGGNIRRSRPTVSFSVNIVHWWQAEGIPGEREREREGAEGGREVHGPGRYAL